MWDPALRPDDVEAERQVILDEILMHADEPADLGAERCVRAALPRTTRSAATRSGPPRASAAARPGDIRAFFERPLPARQHGGVGGRGLRARVRWPGPSRSASPVAGGRRPERQAPDGRRSSRWWCCDGRPSRPTSSSACGRVPRFDERPLGAGRAQPRARRGDVEPAVPEGARATGPGLLDLVGAGRSYQDAGSLAVVVGTAPEHVDEVLTIVTDEIGDAGRPRASPSASWRWPRATCGPRPCSPARTSGPGWAGSGPPAPLHGEVKPVDEMLASHRRGDLDDVRRVAAGWPPRPAPWRWWGPSTRRTSMSTTCHLVDGDDPGQVRMTKRTP